MKSGAIAVVTEDGKKIKNEQFPERQTIDGYELLSTLETDWEQSSLDNHRVVRGRAASESLSESNTMSITADGGVKQKRDERDVVASVSEFAYVPGEFLLTESTQDRFVDDLFEEATGGRVQRGRIDVESFTNAHPEAEPWMGWFRSNEGPIDSGSVFGDIDQEPNLAQYVHQLENSQLGLEQIDYEGRLLKLVLSESGWIAVHKPKDMGTMEFTQFIYDEVLPHTSQDTTGR